MTRLHLARHDHVAPDLHLFRFASASRPGQHNRLLYDATAPAGDPARLTCTCDASLYARLCKHKRWFIHGGVVA